MIEKRISLKIETGDAKRQLDAIKASLSGIDKNMPDGKKDPFKTTTTSTKTARKALIDYTGSLSNANRIVVQSSNYATLAEKASLAQDTALRKLNKVYDEGRIDVTAYNSAIADTKSRYAESVGQLNAVTTATGKGAAGFKVMRGGLSQMSYQLQDIAVQAQMGTNWFTIIGQQGPQIASIFGPLGAVLGVVVALGAAFGGVLYNSIKAANGESENLEKTFESLGKVIKRNAEGVYEFSDAIVDLTKVSNSASKIKIALTLYDAKNSIAQSGKEIREQLEDTTNSWLDFTDVDTARVTKAFKSLGSIGVTSLQQINDGLKLGSGLTQSQVSGVQGILTSVKDVSTEFGVSNQAAFDFLKTVSAIGPNANSDQFNAFIDSLEKMKDSAFSSSTDRQRESFVRMASSLVDLAQNGATAADIVEKLTQNVDADVYAFARPFDNATIAAAKLGVNLTSTQSLIDSISSEYDRLNDLQIKNIDISSDEARNSAKKNSLELIADEISQYDTYAKRLAVINELKDKGLSLTNQDSQIILSQAQEQNYVYEKQINLLSQIGDIISQSTEKTITAANETKAWGELASQLSEVYDQGAKDYAKSVGTYNSSLQSLVTSTFSSMEDAIVSWAETGKLNFKGFVNSAISDLLRLIVQQQLAGFAGAFTSGASATTGTTANAKGGAWGSEGQLSRFATGGITGMVNTVQSTPKRFANGSGMLGEAGQAEAIVPLTRTSGGDLGIKSVGGSSAPVINFNVTNEAGVESASTQSQNANGSIDINIINSLVSKSIASGHADKAITNRFNTSKRGK